MYHKKKNCELSDFYNGISSRILCRGEDCQEAHKGLIRYKHVEHIDTDKTYELINVSESAVDQKNNNVAIFEIIGNHKLY